MLEDGQSWVNKEVPKRDFERMETKNQYNEFVDKVVVTNPGISPQQAYDKILEAERKHNFKFFGIEYPNQVNRNLVNERRRIGALSELNLATEIERQTLEKLNRDFNQTVQEVVTTTNEDLTEVQKNIDTALLYDVADDLAEVKEIMINGPKVEGFEETKDPRIPNALIQQFLKDTFTLEGLRKAKVARITKDDKYLIFQGRSDYDVRRGNELFEKGLARWDENVMMVADDREKYIQAEMFLENVDDPSKLQHTYKIRAVAGDSSGFHKIQLKSFGVEKSSDFDYLGDIELETEEDKTRAYILGTIVHEVAHRYENQLDRALFDEYKKITEEENGPRKKYVSDYVLRHKDTYGSDENTIFKEDFAEAVRIYTTNPEYLKKNYPRRFSFIQSNFPVIKAGSIVKAVSQ